MEKTAEFTIWAKKFEAIREVDIREFLQSASSDLDLYSMKCKFANKYQGKIAISYSITIEFKELAISRHDAISNNKDGKGFGYHCGDVIGSGVGYGCGYGNRFSYSSIRKYGYRRRQYYGAGKGSLIDSAYGCVYGINRRTGSGYGGDYGKNNSNPYIGEFRICDSCYLELINLIKIKALERCGIQIEWEICLKCKEIYFSDEANQLKLQNNPMPPKIL